MCLALAATGRFDNSAVMTENKWAVIGDDIPP